MPEIHEWNNIGDGVADTEDIRTRVLALVDELEALAKHSRAIPERAQAARFDPGPKAMAAIQALAEATPDPAAMVDWADAAHAAAEELREVERTVGEAVAQKGVKGEAEAFTAA